MVMQNGFLEKRQMDFEMGLAQTKMSFLWAKTN
jgi:hypothetical protein